ncbi:MAG: aminoacetone oxidase family FAD-binding enzyme [Chloroflexi bacterium]|nr:aminoacetone oxidase family FAD-binding enzyme [Chloroflexota bacterium]
MTSTRRVGIVGAGPAGIMAALEAARLGAEVHLFDTNATVGRKILVTGNGRCNISNLGADPERYTCADPAFLETVLTLWGPDEVLARLEEHGVLTYATPDGWCYPLSDSAATVVDALAAALDVAGVAVHLQTKIADLEASAQGPTLYVGGPNDPRAMDRVVVATGGKAYPALGSRGEFLAVLERLGHSVRPVLPALAPITAEVGHLHTLQGVRLDVRLAIDVDGERRGETVGNLMFTGTGFSGPAAMDLSHLVSQHAGGSVTVSIDVLPHHRGRLWALLKAKRWEAVPLRILLGAALPAKIALLGVQMAGLPPDARMVDLDWAEIEAVMELLGRLTARATGTRGFQHSQLSTGGVPVTEVDPETMASRRVPGLHLAGEVLDVIAPCGGYNLQFAWASGALAGAGAAQG